MNRRRKSPTLNIKGNGEPERNRRQHNFRGTNLNIFVFHVLIVVSEENLTDV
jgi:hypothetical protein